MDPDTASRFVSSLVQSIQALCHGYVEFSSSIEIVGHIYLNVDKSSKFNYIVNEEVNKDENDLTTVFHTNSYHSLPPGKQSTTTNRLAETDEVSALNRTVWQGSVPKDLISTTSQGIDIILPAASAASVLNNEAGWRGKLEDSHSLPSEVSFSQKSPQLSSSSKRKRKRSPKRELQGIQISSALDPVVVIKRELATSSQNSFTVENMSNGEEHSITDDTFIDEEEPCEDEAENSNQIRDCDPYPVLMHAKLESGDLEQFASNAAILRERKQKMPKKLPLTNAEKCKRFRERIREDPMAYELFQERKKDENRKYLANMSEERKLLKREKDRLRQQKCREKKKAKKDSNSVTFNSMTKKTPSKRTPAFL